MSQNTPTAVWNEVRFTSEGISISLISESPEGVAVVENEMWFTYDELQEMAPSQPMTMRLSQETRDALIDSQRSESGDSQQSESGPSFEAGDEVTDIAAPPWSEDGTVVVKKVTDMTADEYVIQMNLFEEDETVADANPNYPDDDTVVEAVYLDTVTDEQGRLTKAITSVPADDVYAFPESRLQSQS